MKLLNCAINVNDDDSDINLLDCTEISEETNKVGGCLNKRNFYERISFDIFVI